MNLVDLETMLEEIPEKHRYLNAMLLTSYEETLQNNYYHASIEQFYHVTYTPHDNNPLSLQEIELTKLKDAIILIERLESVHLWKKELESKAGTRTFYAFIAGLAVYWYVLDKIMTWAFNTFGSNAVVALLSLFFMFYPLIILFKALNKYFLKSFNVDHVEEVRQEFVQYALLNPFVNSLPANFDNSTALHTIREYITSGRADTLKEALNLYASELQHQDLQNSIHNSIMAAQPAPTFLEAIIGRIFRR